MFNGRNGISFGDFMGRFNQFRGNPMQMLSQSGLKIPQGMNNPHEMIQHLMNSGAMNQQQFNQLQQLAGQIQGNSQFQQMMSIKR